MSMNNKNSSKRPVVKCGKSRVQSQYEHMFNPKKLLEKYGKHSLQLSLQQKPQTFSASNPRDYKESMDLISNADQAFMALPSDLRNRFGNDPYTLLEFLSDPKNQKEAHQLGLVNTPPPEPKVSENADASDPSKTTNDKKTK